MTSSLDLPDQIAPEWPLSADFLSWQRAFISAPINQRAMKVIEGHIDRLSGKNARVRQSRALFVFDLFRGCWAALEYQKAGGVEAEYAARKELREDWERRARPLIDNVTAITRELNREALQRRRFEDKGLGGESLSYSYSDFLLRVFQDIECAGGASLEQTQVALNALVRRLVGMEQPCNERGGGIGCYSYPTFKEGVSDGVPMMLPDGKGKWISNPAVFYPRPSASGSQPSIRNMLVFDLTFKNLAWTAKTLPRVPRLEAGTGGRPCYQLVAELTSLCFPDDPVDYHQAESIAKEYRQKGLIWRGWPCIKKDRPSFLDERGISRWHSGVMDLAGGIDS